MHAWHTSKPARRRTQLVTTDTMANSAENKAILQVIHLPYNVSSAIDDAMNPDFKCSYFSLHINKWNNYIETIKRLDIAQIGKPWLSDEHAFRRQRLSIVTAQAIDRNTTSGLAESSPRNKNARQYPPTTARNTSSSYELGLSNVPFSGIHTHFNTCKASNHVAASPHRSRSSL